MLEIVTIGNETLVRKAAPLREFDAGLTAFIAEMFEALKVGHGLGLAAPQVDRSIRLFVTDVEGDKPRVFINPEIVLTSQETIDWEEGCLSLPGLLGDVERSLEVRVTGVNRRGQPLRLKAQGWLARIFQHEIDHLNGIVFTDRAVRVWQPAEGDPLVDNV